MVKDHFEDVTSIIHFAVMSRVDILFATKSETSDILASVETLLENISNIEFVDIIHLNLLIASCAQNSACDESKFV